MCPLCLNVINVLISAPHIQWLGPFITLNRQCTTQFLEVIVSNSFAGNDLDVTNLKLQDVAKVQQTGQSSN